MKRKKGGGRESQGGTKDSRKGGNEPSRRPSPAANPAACPECGEPVKDADPLSLYLYCQTHGPVVPRKGPPPGWAALCPCPDCGLPLGHKRLILVLNPEEHYEAQR